MSSFFLRISFIFVAIAFMGARSCQEDYELGSQTSVPTVSPTATDDGDGDLITQTATATSTTDPDLTPTETPEVTPTVTATAVTTESVFSAFRELQLTQTVRESSGAEVNNWLGKAFQKKEWIDTDGDGFADWFEDIKGTLIDDPTSFPQVRGGSLASGLRAGDQDLDGLKDNLESEVGTDKTIADSDLDGIVDGVEVRFGSNPRSERSLPKGDSDIDGVPDSEEEIFGLIPGSSDSDSDGLSDGYELVIGLDPSSPDSDRDGISDGKELLIGTDPTVPDVEQ